MGATVPSNPATVHATRQDKDGALAEKDEIHPRFELGLPDSESGVLTVTPVDGLMKKRRGLPI